MPRARKPAINPEEHLGILHHVVQSATLAIPQHLKDEALSEGYVLLVHASRTYDPKHGVPPHYWLARKIRWGLKNWKILEASKHGANEPLIVDYQNEENEWEENPNILLHEDIIGNHELRLELERLVEASKHGLDDDEYIAIFGPAMGMHMKEVSHALGANPNQIKNLQERGRKRINEMRVL